MNHSLSLMKSLRLLVWVCLLVGTTTMANDRVRGNSMAESGWAGTSTTTRVAPATGSSRSIARPRRLEQAVLPKDEWLAQYSLQFQSCEEHPRSVQGTNQTQRLVRFRLCPLENKKKKRRNKGCTTGYGDYTIDMTEFLAHYTPYKFSQDKHMTLQDKKRLGFDMACSRYKPPNERHSNNHHHDQEEGGQKNKKEEYYIGPYCANNGTDIFLGLFSENSCTVYADEETRGIQTYQTISFGKNLRYANQSIVDPSERVSCASPQPPKIKYHDNNNNKKKESDATLLCKLMHSFAQDKCEFRIKGMTQTERNNNGCSHLGHGDSARASSSSSLAIQALWIVGSVVIVTNLLVVVWWWRIQRRRPERAGYGAVVQSEDGYIEMATSNLEDEDDLRGRDDSNDDDETPGEPLSDVPINANELT